MTARSPLTQELTDFLLKSIQKLAKRDPEKFVTCLLGQVAQMDRAAYDWIMTGVMTRTFDECGFNESLGRLKRNLEQNNVSAALEIVLQSKCGSKRSGKWVHGKQWKLSPTNRSPCFM